MMLLVISMPLLSAVSSVHAADYPTYYTDGENSDTPITDPFGQYQASGVTNLNASGQNNIYNSGISPSQPRQPSNVGSLVPCTTPDTCNFQALIQLVNNIINFFFIVSIPITAVLIGYAGIKYLTDGGSGSRVKEAKKLLTETLTGFGIMLTGWLIVNFILSQLTNGNAAYGTLLTNIPH